MKKFIAALLLAFLIAGCGGGNEDTPITADKVLTLNVSKNILKLSYLPSYDIDNAMYEIIDTSTEGNSTLLDSTSGRYSYLTTSDKNDTFEYKVFNDSGDDYMVEVNIVVGQIPVMTNDGSEADFNTSAPTGLTSKELLDFSSNLPVMVLDVGDETILDDPKIDGTLTLFEPGSDGRTRLSATPSHIGYMEIEMRGSSSQYYYPKKQYGMDTVLYDGEDDDLSWFGMPEEHKWILQAPYSDKSLMRNYLAYNKTREIDESKYYAVRTQYVEVLMRVGDQYRYDGVYVLMEKIKRDSGRLDIEKLGEEDVLFPEITGGYILKKDGAPDPDEFSFYTTLGTEIIVYYPEDEDLTPDQKYYIESHIQLFEQALKNDDFNVTTSDNYYGKWIDTESFIVHLLSRELFMDVDTWLFSEYFHKDREKNLSMTPVWDFNAGMGNNDFRLEGRTDGWVYEVIKENYDSSSLRYWMERLMSDPSFKTMVDTKWQSLRSGIWSDANLTNFIAQTQTTLTESAERNFERWPNVLGTYIWPNRKACMDAGELIYCPTFERAVNEHLKTWLLERAHWIDTQF